MFVCAHYGAGVCLDFHCKDFAFGIRKGKKKGPKIQIIILVLNCADHLGKSARLFEVGKIL